MTLTDFLLARIAEDERLAFADAPRRGRDWELTQIDDSRSWDLLAMSHRRVLAECEAKRAIVQGWGQFLAGAPEWAEREMPSVLRMARMTLHALALPYADHEDYDEGWRP